MQRKKYNNNKRQIKEKKTKPLGPGYHPCGIHSKSMDPYCGPSIHDGV